MGSSSRGVLLGLALVAAVGLAGPGDDVYRLTAHGSTSVGVDRVVTAPRGHCLQCHLRQAAPWTQPTALFTSNDNTLCFACHAGGNASGTYGGQAAYTSSAHWASGQALWPGPTPVARPPGDEGKCLNCHAPHGAEDALGLVPDLTQVREEALCFACHDATGPSTKNILIEAQKRAAHAPQASAGRHAPGESTGAAFAAGAARHVECPDCHNPHRAYGPDGGTSQMLSGASRVRFQWDGGAQFVFMPNGDVTSMREYEVCFKCHASFTTLPVGARDKAAEFDPRGASFHPVVAPGKNASVAMANSLAGGTGLPHLTVASLIECQDCHASNSIPTSVSTVSSYQGAVARGPHGSAIAPDAGYAGALLRARYRTSGATAGITTDFELCFICHASAPFTGSGATATNFSDHRKHVSGANALCNECHEDLHGTRLATQPANRASSRLVSFPLTVTGPSGSGAPSWTPKTTGSNGSCTLRCHGKAHNNETY